MSELHHECGLVAIYHLPGDNGYTATDPERCFLDVAEAKLAGFRAPK